MRIHIYHIFNANVEERANGCAEEYISSRSWLPTRNGCSSSGRSVLRGASCIRSVFNVSFSHRFMGGHLTQIWSIYVRSSPRSHFERPRLSGPRGSTQFGARNAFPRHLFCHISSRASFPRLRPRVSADINNRPGDSRRLLTAIPYEDHESRMSPRQLFDQPRSHARRRKFLLRGRRAP